MKLEFKRIDLTLHRDVAIQFRADSYVSSFGNADEFWGQDGRGDERYVMWLSKRDPKKFGAFHLWLAGEIIGQMEMTLFN